MNICAGIVLYNPDAELLKKNVEAALPQVGKIVFVDNASSNVDDLRNMFCGDQFKWIVNNENKGISGALNQLMEFADNNGYAFV